MDADRARQLLEQRRRDLETVARAATEQGALDEEQASNSGEVSLVDQHSADVATDTLEREMGLSVRESAEASLRDVDRALRKIETGNYGVCEACGQPIGDERLEARTEAAFCIDHQPAATPQD